MRKNRAEILSIKTSDIIDYFGGNKAELARFLDISPQSVYQWPNKDIPVRHKYTLLSYLISNKLCDEKMVQKLLDPKFNKT